MAGAAGLEPTDDGVKVRCLTNLATPLSLGKVLLFIFLYKLLVKYGGGGGPPFPRLVRIPLQLGEMLLLYT